MKLREFDPIRLDVKAFAKAAGELTGSWPVTSFERLADLLSVVEAGEPAAEVHWSAAGSEVAVLGGAPQVWLSLQAQAGLPMQCQRCLKAFPCPVVVRTRIQFVHDEATAAEIDADAEHDVLVFGKELDLHELLEDELLLALPLVPRHEVCPEPLAPPAAAEPAPSREHPFAALAGLQTGKR